MQEEQEEVTEEVVVKQEPLDDSEERFKCNPGLSAKIAEAKARLDGVRIEEETTPSDEVGGEEYGEGDGQVQGGLPILLPQALGATGLTCSY